jgi:nucleotide-binding universal stress UspA family protein
MTRSVLVAVDGSPLSFSALRHALTVFPESTVVVLHVVDVFEPGYGAYPDFETSYEPLMGTEEWYERANEISDQLFEECRSIAGDHDRSIETVSEIGDPKRIIVEFAAEEDVDHIVVGAHGRPDQDRSVYGSVADVVARRASVPVTLYR